MPLDATKLHAAIMAQNTHECAEDCEFCKFFKDLKKQEQAMKSIAVTSTLMVLTCTNTFQFFYEAFASGFIMGVKMERARVMEDEFKI